ncbi:MAG: DUF4202 domain-containing protein [Chloroflexota bacterium]
MTDQRFETAIGLIDNIHAKDPTHLIVDGNVYPQSLFQARRRTYWLGQLVADEPAEPLKLAVRAQHLRRWEIPRSSYPQGRTGYLAWRKDLKAFHAKEAAAILQKVGYPTEIIERVETIILKKRLKLDLDVQYLEDTLCLVFLETQFSDFAQKEADKIGEIVRKTWRKMSERGQQLALQLPLSSTDQTIVERALAQV